MIIVAACFPFFNELRNSSTWIQSASLPVSRKEMVIARYLISLAIVFANFMIWIVAYNLLQALIAPEVQYVLTGKVVSYAIMDLIFSLAAFYFIYYRFKHIISIGLYVLLMILPTALRAILSTKYIPLSDAVVENVTLFSVGSVVALALFIISFLSSIYSFPRKDL